MNMKIRYGLCGAVLGHSYSPLIHAALGNENYCLLPMSREEFRLFLEKREFSGVNVTIPYKTDAYKLCDELSERAKRIGSVNTVVNCGGNLFGDNTDIGGFLGMVRRGGIDLCGKHVLILGSGGTSLTAQAACAETGAASALVVSRRGKLNYDNVYGKTDTEVIINATPVGMYPHNGEAPIDLSRFPHLCGVVDVIYNPSRTCLLSEAEKRRIPAVGGLYMLVYQAILADELFFDKNRTEEERMTLAEEITALCKKRMKNIVLIGMPGSGKTTVGKLIAEKTGRPFLDTDEMVTSSCGKTPRKMILTEGEAAFRSAETKAVLEAVRRSGCVVAVGGGAVLAKENREAFRENSVVVCLERALDKLPLEGRPISEKNGVRALYEERMPYYRQCADAFYEVNEDPETCAERIIRERL